MTEQQGWAAPRAAGAVTGTVTVPGSKSISNRALVLAALADGPSHLTAVPTVEPQGGNGLTLRAFQNLGYTLEWFVFAGFVVFMWFRLLRREVEFARDAELGLLPEDESEQAARVTV